MAETPRFVYLTTPQAHEPVLNIAVGENLTRYLLTFDQLKALNAQFADALWKYKTPAVDQPAFVFEADGPVRLSPMSRKI
jgi:hypothetical protein